MSQPMRIYRLPGFTRGIFLCGAVFFGGAAVLAASTQGTGLAYVCLAPLALFSAICFVWSLYTVRLDENEIAVTAFLQTTRLAWHDIAGIQFKESGFVLTNSTGDRKLHLNSQVPGFVEIVNTLMRKNPALWNQESLTEFHTTRWAVAFFIGISLFGLVMISAGIQGLVAGSDSWWTNVGVIVIGLLCAACMIAIPTKDSFEQDYLVIGSLFRKRRIHVSEIAGFVLEPRMIEYGIQYPVHVKLKNGKALIFDNLREGTFLFDLSLRAWLARHGYFEKER